MTKIITQLGTQFAKALKTADEIWVAVGLMNEQGLNFITERIPARCKQNYLVGIDLPSHPQTLNKLFMKHSAMECCAKVYKDKRHFFHPKLYLIRTKNKFVAFVGSANCTSGGLDKNIELTYQVDNSTDCQTMKHWFLDSYAAAAPLTKDFLEIYTKEYKKRIDRQKADQKTATSQKTGLDKQVTVNLREERMLIALLKSKTRLKGYTAVRKQRADNIRELRKTLDYPNFINLDVEGFFDNWNLGHIIPVNKPVIKRQHIRFSTLLHMLCDETIDIATRYDQAFSDQYKIRGVKEGVISKLLTIHRPDLYYVKNSKSVNTLTRYGLTSPRGLSRGQKYRATSNFLLRVCKAAGIKDLAVLDYYLYFEAD